MPINFDELPAQTQQQLQKTYQHQWWAPEFSETHPTVSFLMQVLNRQYFNLGQIELDSHPIQQSLYFHDPAVENIIACERQKAVRFARLAVADMMADGKGTAFRFATSDVMTDGDRQDLSALLAGLNKKEPTSRRS